MTEPVCRAYAAAHCDHDFLAWFTEEEQAVLPFVLDLWLRPEQFFPPGDWHWVGFVCGRGWGKTHAIACYINSEVEAGRIHSLCLLGPNEDRVDEVMIQTLIDAAPPWFTPERAHGGLRWPNGVFAEVHSAEAPESTRSSNFDFAWLCEIVAWAPSTRAKAFANVTTATRAGRAQFVWDTTSQGINEVIEALEADARARPDHCKLVRGTTFDNPMFTKKYLAGECRKYSGQRLDEELGGIIFRGSAGALWDTDILNDTRRPARPERPRRTIVAVDPQLSVRPTADETGIIVGDEGQDGETYIHADESGHHTAEAWSGIVVDWCAKGATGVIIETNHAGNPTKFAIESTARFRGMTTEDLPRDKPFPPRRPGHIFIKEVFASSSKGTRAMGPATEYAHDRAHIVGAGLRELERELCTYVPGERGQDSPNRFDAHAHLVTELAGLGHDSPGARAKQDAAGAKVAADELRRRLAGAARGARVGM